MAGEGDKLIGKWWVKCGPYLWEYTFAADGSVRWRDPFNGQTGGGRWTEAESGIKFSWHGSRTKETWNVPVSATDQTGHVSASYGEHDITATFVAGTSAAEISAATAALEAQVNDLYTNGRITFSSANAETGFRQAMNHDRVGGFTARHSLPLLQTMIAFASDAGNLQILRSFAANDGPHGAEGLCQAVDVAMYGSYMFEYRRGKSSLIDGVTKLIGAVPDAVTFDLGLVRPVGGVGGFDTSLDVFFRVTAENVQKLKRDPETHKVLPGQAPNAVEPGAGWGFGALLPDAKREIGLARKGKKLNYCYPDGADHVHIKAY